MTVTKKKLINIILLVLIFSTVLFIFSRSMLSREASSEESRTVGGLIAVIFPRGTILGDFVQDNIRKIAHFAEFFVLGIELSVYAYLCMKRKPYVLFAYLFAFMVAFFDETIQIFSGRGPSILDVWIDFLGAFFAFTLIYLIPTAIFIIRSKNNRTENNRG